MISSRIIITTFLILATIGCQGNKTSDIGRNEFIKWANSNAVPILTDRATYDISDLTFLEPMIGCATLVGLGDSRHDANEQYQLKIKFIKYLILELDFNMIAIEEGLPHAEKINRYLLDGTGNIEELMNQMGAWFIWDTKEFFVLIQWLREHNLKSPVDKQIRFTGIDITDPLPSIELLLTYFKDVDSDFANSIEKIIDREIYRVDIWNQIMQNYSTTDKNKLVKIGEQFSLILTHLQKHRAEFIEKSSTAEYEWVCRNAECLTKSHDLFRKMSEGDVPRAGVIRESGMSDNLLWHMASSGENCRAIVWAHNFHIAEDAFDLDLPNMPLMSGLIPMGKYLADSLGEKFVSIGMSFHNFNDPNQSISPIDSESIDGTLADISLDTYIIDLRSVPTQGSINNWITTKHAIRGQGNEGHLILKDSFDMIAFVRQISKTTPSQKAALRFRSMR
ncbi:MAG: erythromycin esterase family protein [candidate division Zixibacteria bacterium]|nr:erythromycin esterase family protein [candidate division Zixibacteria bacterium]